MENGTISLCLPERGHAERVARGWTLRIAPGMMMHMMARMSSLAALLAVQITARALGVGAEYLPCDLTSCTCAGVSLQGLEKGARSARQFTCCKGHEAPRQTRCPIARTHSLSTRVLSRGSGFTATLPYKRTATLPYKFTCRQGSHTHAADHPLPIQIAAVLTCKPTRLPCRTYHWTLLCRQGVPTRCTMRRTRPTSGYPSATPSARARASSHTKSLPPQAADFRFKACVLTASLRVQCPGLRERHRGSASLPDIGVSEERKWPLQFAWRFAHHGG